MSDTNGQQDFEQTDGEGSQESQNQTAHKKVPVPHKDRQHPDREEMRLRVDCAGHLLARRLYKSDMIRLMKRRFSITARTCERYLSHARKVRAAERTKRKGMTPEQLQEKHRADSEEFWEAVIRGPAVGMIGDGQLLEDRDRTWQLRGDEVAEPCPICFSLKNGRYKT